jgi:hypothetical protein
MRKQLQPLIQSPFEIFQISAVHYAIPFHFDGFCRRKVEGLQWTPVFCESLLTLRAADALSGMFRKKA